MTRCSVRNLLVRAATSLAAGLAVAGIAFLVAFMANSEAYARHLPAYSARNELDRLEKAAERFREAQGRLPASLADVDLVKEGYYKLDVAGSPLDPFGHAYEYSAQGGRITLLSLGRDGRPGGEGADADVYPRSARRLIPKATFWRFVSEYEIGNIYAVCLLSGLTAGVTNFTQNRDRPGSSIFLMQLAMTIIGTVLASIPLVLLAIPSGH